MKLKSTIYFKILVLFISLVLSQKTFGQLKVRTNGTVKIGTESPVPSGGSLEITGINQTLEARIFSSSANISRFWTINSVFAFGFGVDQNGYGQIFKNINTPTAIMTFNSNGDFGIGRSPSYKLDINGNIRVNTTIYTSDSILKYNIRSISGKESKLSALNGVSYLFRQLNEDKATQYETSSINKILKSNSTEDYNRIHYGFIAQEVQKIFPELVYQDNNGILGIDYVAFIPLLVEEFKTQNEEIATLKSEIAALKSSMQIPLSSSKAETSCELYQNYPNPFNEATSIKFKIANSVNIATLFIYDLSGKQIKKLQISTREENSISIKGSELNPGMYLYTLVADGIVIDTKQMILTN